MPIPPVHSVVPNLCLPNLQGHPIALWDYKHERPIVLVFCAAADDPLLAGFARRYADYRAENAEVLAVVPERPRRSDWPFPVLIDPTGQAPTRFTGRVPAVLLLDSFNELLERLEAPGEGLDHDRILGWIAEAELKCPECGVPEWPR